MAGAPRALEAREEPICQLSFGSSLALHALGEQREPLARHGQSSGQHFKQCGLCFACLVTCLLLDADAEQEALVLSLTSMGLSPAGFVL